MNTVHDVRVDAELDRLVERRSGMEPAKLPDELEPSYAESVRRYNARLLEERRAQWREYHREQAARLRAVLEGAVERHEEAAGVLEDPSG